MKKSILILTGVFFALTLILPACKNKSTKEDTKKEGEKKKEVEKKIENECMMVINMDISSDDRFGEYDPYINAFVGARNSKMTMSMSFEGNILWDSTFLENDMDTIYVGEVNEESLELISILRDSSSVSGIMGSVDTIVSTFTYTTGEFDDIVDGKEVTITETNESFEKNKQLMKDLFARLPLTMFDEEIIDGEVSVNILGADPEKYKISQEILRPVSQKVTINSKVKFIEKVCVEMRKEN